MPNGVPRVIRAGIGNGQNDPLPKSLFRASLGVQGADSASLHRPLPFVCLGLPLVGRSLPAIRVVPARFRPKGKGHTPAPRLAALARWPLPTNRFPVSTQSSVTGKSLAVSHETVLFVFPIFMENTQELSVHVRREAYQGCLRIRLRELYVDKDRSSFSVEVAAWNTVITLDKLVFFQSGMNLVEAEKVYSDLVSSIEDYDWLKGQFVYAPAV